MSQAPKSGRDRLNQLIGISKEYESRADQIQMQLDLLNQSIAVTQITGETIENLKNLQDGQEILLPLGNLSILGNIAYIKAKLMDSSTVLVNVGASVVIEKPIGDAKDLLDKQLEELNKIKAQLSQAMQQIIQNIQQIRNEIERLAADMQQQQQQQQQQPMMGGS